MVQKEGLAFSLEDSFTGFWSVSCDQSQESELTARDSRGLFSSLAQDMCR